MLVAQEAQQLKQFSMQTELIQAEIRGEKTPLNLLMVHAQDHLMCALVVIDLAQEFIDVYKKLA